MTDQSRETEKDKGWPGLPANMPLFADLWDDLKSTDAELCLGNSESKSSLTKHRGRDERRNGPGFCVGYKRQPSFRVVRNEVHCTPQLGFVWVLKNKQTKRHEFAWIGWPSLSPPCLDGKKKSRTGLR
jgi:hypothetical protein